MEIVTLFYEERSDIKISMKIYFTDIGQLFFDGYDSGKKVEQIWGDSDYEYTYTIEPDQLDKFYKLFDLKKGDKSGLLQELKKRFGVNKAYSLLGEFMNKHNIKYSGSTWT